MSNNEPKVVPTTESGLDQNIAAALAYLFIPALIFIFTEKTNKYVRFHSFQSIFLTVVSIAVSIVSTFLGFIPILGLIFGLLSCVVSILLFVVWLVCVYKAYTGEMFKLPVIGDLAEKQANNPVA